MEHTKHLEDLNQETLKKLEAFMKTKGEPTAEHHEKILSKQKKWQLAWNEFLETLLVLEKLEI